MQAFEYDPQKSEANLLKHGINFKSAQALWQDEAVIEILLLAVPEPRYAVIGKIEGIYWTAITTYRGNTVRLISVRRSRKKEVHFYENVRP